MPQVEPEVAQATVLERIEDERTRFHVLADAAQLLFLGVLNLEDHVTVVEREIERDAPADDLLGHDPDAPEILGPHVNVELERRLVKIMTLWSLALTAAPILRFCEMSGSSRPSR